MRRGDPEGFRSGMFRFGPLLGASAARRHRRPRPLRQASPVSLRVRRKRSGCLVLAGRPTLRHPEGEDVLAPWDVVCFPTGPRGAHAVRNDTDQTVRVLMWSTVRLPAATVYPDSDKIGIWTGQPRRRPHGAPHERRRLLGRRERPSADGEPRRPRRLASKRARQACGDGVQCPHVDEEVRPAHTPLQSTRAYQRVRALRDEHQRQTPGASSAGG